MSTVAARAPHPATWLWLADPITAPAAVVAANARARGRPKQEVADMYAARLARAYMQEDEQGRKALLDAATDVAMGSPVVGLQEAARLLLWAVGL